MASAAPDRLVRRAERVCMQDRVRLLVARPRAALAALSPTVSVRLILGCAAAALATCVLGFALFVEWRSVTYTVASVHEERANLAPAPPAEERPERNTDGTYTRANVRYCTFQQI